MSTAREQSPAIYRCTHCGALVHPADPGSSSGASPFAWCQRCGRYVPADLDGPG